MQLDGVATVPYTVNNNPSRKSAAVAALVNSPELRDVAAGLLGVLEAGVCIWCGG